MFGAGTVQWAWGLDNGAGTGNTDSAMQQATVNLFADMGAQPFTLISGLTPATASTDTTAPTSTITSPSQGAALSDGSAVTISGSATDAGRRRGRRRRGLHRRRHDMASGHHDVHPEHLRHLELFLGRPWEPLGHDRGPGRRRQRQPGKAGGGHDGQHELPLLDLGSRPPPRRPSDSGDPASIEVGVKFKADTFGYVTGIRFYKASANTGTHVGNLWTSGGQLLASATFTGESASGWQQVNFAQPVALNKNTTYVASYFAPKGHYAQDGGYFYTVPQIGPTATSVDSPPLHALRNTNGVVNGVYSYAGASTFPTSTVDAANYWVDPVFSPEAFTTPPGQASNVSATAGFASAT